MGFSSRDLSHEVTILSMDLPEERGASWTLLTGHGHVLVEIARNPDARIRDISPVVALTERTVQAIVADLEDAGYLTRTRIGRRTRYTVNRDSPFRHRAQEGLRVGPMLDLLTAMADVAGPNSNRRRAHGGSGGSAPPPAGDDAIDAGTEGNIPGAGRPEPEQIVAEGDERLSERR